LPRCLKGLIQKEAIGLNCSRLRSTQPVFLSVTPIQHSDRKTDQVGSVRWQCGKQGQTPCKVEIRPTSSQRYDQSVVIRQQTTRAVRNKPCLNRYDRSPRNTMGEEFVTLVPAKGRGPGDSDRQAGARAPSAPRLSNPERIASLSPALDRRGGKERRSYAGETSEDAPQL
jgi:hypothetical protein